MTESPPIQIDLDEVLTSKLGKKARFVPKGAVSWLKKTIHEDELNHMLRTLYPRTGADFCDGVFDYLDASITIANPEALEGLRARRIMVVSNHPLGGLDGMAIISCLSPYLGEGLRFLVNDLLMAVKPLSHIFLPINKHGRQDRQAIKDINDVMASDAPVVIFPAGLVSRKGDDGTIRDLQWNKMFVNKAVEYKRDVLPIYFSGENSKSFYNLARWRKRLRIGFNIEMLYLPDEMLKCRGRSFTITIGDPIPWQTLQSGPKALQQAQQIKDKVYTLSNLQKNNLVEKE